MITLRKKIGWFCLLLLVGIGLAIPYTALAKAPPVNTWHKVDNVTGNQLQKVITTDNGFIAVGANGTIIKSSNGTHWTYKTGLIGGRINAVALGDDGYVAVGEQGILFSSDGDNWSSHAHAGEKMAGVVWANNLYIAVGDQSTIMTSGDGENWNTKKLEPGNHYYSIIWANNMFVAVGGRGGGTDRIITSTDGVNWTTRSGGNPGYLRGIVWGNNQFVAVGENGKVRTSSDGVLWIDQDSGFNKDLWDVVWGNNQYVAVGRDGAILTSLDGESWTVQEPLGTDTLYSITSMENKYVAVGNDGAIYHGSYTVNDFDVDLTEDAISSRTIDFKWSKATDATSVNIQMKLSSEDHTKWKPATTAATIDADTTSAVVTGLAPGTEYNFRLHIVGAWFNDYSNAVTVTTLNEYTLTYTAGANGSVDGPSPQTVVHGRDGAPVTAKPNPNYHFVQWSDGNTDNPRRDMNVTGDITVTAEFAINKYTVTFDVYGGVPAIAPVIVNYNDKVSAPDPAPVKPGHALDGWYTDSAYSLPPFDFSTPIQSDITLYAKWNTNAYTVTFDVYGGTPVPDQIVVYLGKVTEPSPPPTKPGHTFGGWFADIGYSTPFDFANTPITENITIYGKWTTDSFTVSFDVDGGTYVNNQYIAYLDPVAEPAAPTKPGHTFAGWFTDSTFNTAYDFAASAVTQDTVIYAKWTINQYTVSFETNGGSVIPDVHVDYDTAISAPANPVRNGYTFDGWYKDVDLKDAWIFGTDKVQEDITLYAKWKRKNSNVQTIVDEPGPTEDLGFEIVINGSQEDQWARAVMIEQDGKQSIGVFFDEASFHDRLNQEGNSFTVTIPAVDVEKDITGFLDGATVKLMEEKQAILEIQTKLATYTIPAEQINIDAVSEVFGADVNLQDIVIGIEIAAPTAEMVRIAENAANQGEFAIVVPPLEFSVKAAYGGAVHEVHSYSAYVERMIAIPDNVDPGKITTAVVVEPDGTLRHVPTKVVVIDH